MLAWELEPPPRGAVFRIINFPAHHKGELHRTDTLDFGVVLEGELWLLLEEGEVHLTQHDCNRIAGQLNHRPRKRLSYRTPEECYAR